MATRPRAGRPPLAWAEGARQVRETLPLPTRLDVHALQGDRPSLQVTHDESPQARSNSDSVDHEKRRPISGRVEHDRPHHEPERGIDVDRSLKAGVRKSGGELSYRAFLEPAPDGRGAEQRQGAKIKACSQDQHRP